MEVTLIGGPLHGAMVLTADAAVETIETFEGRPQRYVKRAWFWERAHGGGPEVRTETFFAHEMLDEEEWQRLVAERFDAGH